MSSNPFSSRQVTTGRKVNFGFLEEEGFEIGNMLKNLGWQKLCSLDLPTYPALVQEFYSTAGRGDRGLIGTVRGKPVSVNQSILSHLLDMPTEGLAPQGHSDRAGALSRLLGREVTEFEEVHANQLSVEMRLLHNIIGRILFPKTGRFDFISERDIVMIDCIINGYPINLPSMMISYMGEASTKKKSSLPYGMVLTLIFRSHGIEIPKNEPKKSLRHTDYYNISTLHRMGYKKINGIWEKKSSEDLPTPRRQSDQPGPSSIPEVSISAPSASQPPSVTSDMIESLKDFIRSEQENTRNFIKQQMETAFDRIENLGTRITALEDQYSRSAALIKDEILTFTAKIKELSDDSKEFSDSNAKLFVHIDKALKQLEEMFSNFKRCQKDGMEAILDRIKRIFGAI